MDNSLTAEVKSLLSSPGGQELLRSLQEDLHDNLVKEAETSDKMGADERLRLLNTANGVTKAIAHLHSIAAVPADEGNKDA